MRHSSNIFIWVLCFLIAHLEISGYDDLSYGKNTAQGSPYNGGRFMHFYAADNAADRSNISCTRTQEIGPSSFYKETWWNVDLGGIFRVFSIRIQFKDYGEKHVSRQRGRFAGFSLYLSNSSNKDEGYVCYKDGPELPPLDFTTICIGYARYVIYYNERLNNYTYPEEYQYLSYTELCEVIVFGCKRYGVYGERCDKECPKGCQDNECDIVTVECSRCKPSWKGNYCETHFCDNGYYGENCTSKCSSKCIDNCNHLDGTCICSPGLRGSPNCTTGCPSGFYGPNCGHICSQHCRLNDSCDSINRTCTQGCKDSYRGPRCDVPVQTYGKYREKETSRTVLLAAVVSSGIINVLCLVTIAVFKRKQITRIWKEKSAGSETYFTRTEIHANQTDDIHDYQEIGKSEKYSNFQLISS